MKKSFFEYNMQELGYIDEVKKNSIIVLDTNSLLNLYRYNSNNREKFFEILDKVKGRLILTNKSVEEFYRNRETILKAKSKFGKLLSDETTNEIVRIKNIIENINFKGKESSTFQLLRHEPELKKDLINILEETCCKINESIESYINEAEYNFIEEDPLLFRITSLFEGKVNKRLSKEDLEKIYKDGKVRYKNSIPPGYEDLRINKKPEPDCYGDLVIWKEMIEISKSKDSNILFVSDDTKDDWIEEDIRKRKGPRKELIREMFEETGKLFYLLSTSNFIKAISELYKIEDTKDLENETELIRKGLNLKDDSSYNSELSSLIVIFLNKFAQFEELIFNIMNTERKLMMENNFLNPVKLIRYLYNNNRLEKSIYENAECIIKVRNELVHNSHVNISISDMKNYIEILESIIDHLFDSSFND